MSNKIYYFTGTAKWAKLQKPDEKYDIYTLDLYLTDDSYLMFKDSGLELKLREGDEGKYIKLRRPVSRQRKVDGVKTLEELGPPEVLLLKDGSYEPYAGLVGNGSSVVCKVRVYDTEKGKGHELQTVAIEALETYEEVVGGEDYPF